MQWQSLFWILTYEELLKVSSKGWAILGQVVVYVLALGLVYKGYFKPFKHFGFVVGLAFVFAVVYPEIFLVVNVLTYLFTGEVLFAYMVPAS